jgi:cytochrome bd ubiquinol oxidase subunit I
MLELLSRLQFAFTVGFHYLFVPATIGLIVPAAIFETMYFRTRRPMYKGLSEFWSEIFIVSYVIGIVTGLTMPIQFGTNWSKYSVFMGDVFGSPLAFEALLAFFIESTFAGIWIFKRNKIGPALRMATIWLIVLGTSISAVWILTADSFMQHPVGYKLAEDGSKVLLTSFKEVLLNPYVAWMFVHNHAAALLLGAFIVLGVSAYHLRRDGASEGLKKSVNLALIIAIIASASLPIIGDLYGKYIATVQPLKAAVLLNRLAPDANGALALDASSSASLKPDLAALPGSIDVPLVHTSYVVMVVLGILLAAVTLLFLVRRKLVLENRFFQSLAAYLVPAAYVAIICGWIVAEAGRQPWIVYGLMSVSQGISDVPVASVAFSLFLIFTLYALLFAGAIRLTFKIIRKGPDLAEEGRNAAA